MLTLFSRLSLGARPRVLGRALYLALLIAVGCGFQKHSEAGLVFKNWYVIKPVVAGSGSVAYGTIKNESAAPQILKKVEFGCAAGSELHETITEGSRVRMAPLPPLTIHPGDFSLFEPGHKHVMLQKIEIPGDGKCPAVFTFESAVVRFSVSIRERQK